MYFSEEIYRHVELAMTKMEVHRWKLEGSCKLDVLPFVLQCKHCDFSDLTADACLSLHKIKRALK